MLNYGLVLSVASCNLYLDRLSKECDKKTATAVVVFREFPKVGVCWNVASYKTLSFIVFVNLGGYAKLIIYSFLWS